MRFTLLRFVGLKPPGVTPPRPGAVGGPPGMYAMVYTSSTGTNPTNPCTTLEEDMSAMDTTPQVRPMPPDLFDRIADHVGHQVFAHVYGDCVNATIECETCGVVIIDADGPDDGVVA